MADQSIIDEAIMKAMAEATRVAIQAMAETQATKHAKYIWIQGRQSHTETTQL